MKVQAWVLLLSVLCFLNSATAQEQPPDVFYIPTPHDVVEIMLQMAEVEPGDIVYDLGSGDGRFVIMAAAEFGACGVGIEIDSDLVAESRENARKAGVEDHVRIIHGDLFETDFSEADVVTLFLLTDLNLRLRPRLLNELRPGTPVVSHLFDMGDWEPDMKRIYEITERRHELYLWYVPASVAGEWSWEMPAQTGSNEMRLLVRQEYQIIDVEVISNAQNVQATDAVLQGDSISIVVELNDVPVRFEGQVNGEVINGKVYLNGGAGEKPHTWTAFRVRRED